MYSSTLPSTSALDGVGGQRHAPAALPPGKTRYPLYRSLGGPQGLSVQVRKISAPTVIRSPDRPARSESLYRPSYPDPLDMIHDNNDGNTEGGPTEATQNGSIASFAKWE